MAHQRRHAIRRRAGLSVKKITLAGVGFMQRIAHHPAQHIGAKITPVIYRPALRQRAKLFSRRSSISCASSSWQVMTHPSIAPP
jgi:hypothetical protein